MGACGIQGRAHHGGRPPADADTDAVGRGLPPGCHAAVTWTIPAEYGGMTSALLRRSRVLAREGGAPVRVLVLDPGLDAAAARAALEARGELVPGVTLHHVWEDLRAMPDGASRPAGRRAVERVRGEPGERVRTTPGGAGRRETLHFRDDGTLAVRDVRTRWQHRITLYGRGGAVERRWWSTAALHRWWLDRVLGDGPAYVLVDDKALVGFFASFRRERTRTVHVVHGSHLMPDARDAHGPVVPSRRPLVEHVDRFDAVVLLTERQREDLRARVGPRGHVAVVPNSAALPPEAGPPRAEPGRGAVVAALTPRKRVGHAVRAVGAARRGTARDVTLDVFGDGPRRASLEEQAGAWVTWHGYVPDAAERLAQASFLLLTSRSEGSPLVLVEAMARGCVPIAYDIRYGPADVVRDGVDGFLVPDGDVEALAAALVRFVELPDDAVARMRAAARRRALDFSDAAVLDRWAEVLRDVGRRPGGRARRRPMAGMLRGA